MAKSENLTVTKPRVEIKKKQQQLGRLALMILRVWPDVPLCFSGFDEIRPYDLYGLAETDLMIYMV